ncbi:hypothetical protein TREES_T100020462 [Tupaia chinensis]|uniref:Uncharacterized protein n=1 Tax=Tupaia chinensis TaxID=246437 RepID=L9KX06_TUPCH|nr:hypothetical protein TREES_T100020462 [Tupaia chinensis]
MEQLQRAPARGTVLVSALEQLQRAPARDTVLVSALEQLQRAPARDTVSGARVSLTGPAQATLAKDHMGARTSA